MATKLDFRRPHLLRDGAEYQAAVREVERLMDTATEPGSVSYERLEFLSVLVVQYEEEHHAIPAATPQDIVEFTLEQRGLERADLYEAMGGKARVSEFFAGKRDLSIGQVRALRSTLGISGDLLIPDGGTIRAVDSTRRRVKKITGYRKSTDGMSVKKAYGEKHPNTTQRKSMTGRNKDGTVRKEKGK